MSPVHSFLFVNICWALFWAMVSAQDMVQHRHQPVTTSNPATMSTECRRQQSNCTDNVYPYLNDPQYMFPTSLEHVNEMCKMWSRFVDCIRRYIANCFEENRRQLFHKSVENSIDTVHAICSSKLYQAEYLKKANCFKQVSMDHCGPSYHALIDNIANPMAKDEHICCSYAQFKQCVNRPLLEECGRKAKNLMDHSMSFLISRCDHYNYQKPAECPQPIPISKSIDERPKTLYRIHDDDDDDDDNNDEDDENDRFNLIDSTTSASFASKVVPVFAESREWPSAASSMDGVSEVVAANQQPMANNIDQSKHDQLLDQNDPEMIIYTIKPQSQIASMLSASGCNVIHSSFIQSTILYLVSSFVWLLL